MYHNENFFGFIDGAPAVCAVEEPLGEPVVNNTKNSDRKNNERPCDGRFQNGPFVAINFLLLIILF